MFARQFKPKISVDSSEYMVEEYKRLRQRDSSGQLGISNDIQTELTINVHIGWQVQHGRHGESQCGSWRV